jgi:hypothetical protein
MMKEDQVQEGNGGIETDNPCEKSQSRFLFL